MEPGGSLPCSQEPATHFMCIIVIFVKMFQFFFLCSGLFFHSLNPVDVLIRWFLNIHFNIIFPSTPRHLKLCHLFRFYVFLFSPIENYSDVFIMNSIYTTAICYLDFIHPPCFLTTTFRGMVFPSSSGEPNLLGPVDRASLYRWTLSTKHAGHTFQLCEDLTMS
jgi:hypothetical protein